MVGLDQDIRPPMNDDGRPIAKHTRRTNVRDPDPNAIVPCPLCAGQRLARFVDSGREPAQPHGMIYNEEVRNTAGRPLESLYSSSACCGPGNIGANQARNCTGRSGPAWNGGPGDPHYADAWAALALIYIDEVASEARR